MEKYVSYKIYLIDKYREDVKSLSLASFFAVRDGIASVMIEKLR